LRMSASSSCLSQPLQLLSTSSKTTVVLGRRYALFFLQDQRSPSHGQLLHVRCSLKCVKAMVC
jgi:hypothetical protein